MGGTGKTPLAIELHRIFKKLRRKTVFIKKFYNESIDEANFIRKRRSIAYLQKMEGLML